MCERVAVRGQPGVVLNGCKIIHRDVPLYEADFSVRLKALESKPMYYLIILASNRNAINHLECSLRYSPILYNDPLCDDNYLIAFTLKFEVKHRN
jgi:hypothetical protein